MSSDSSNFENSIRDIISAMYAKNDVPFMDAIVLQLAKTLKADHVFVGELQEENFSVKTLSHCMDNAIVDGFEYMLVNTPCEVVYNGEVAVYPKNITNLFPSDQDLKDLNIEGYSGIPLFNDKQETFGAIVALYREPIENPDFVSSIMKLFANQVANEIERQHSEQKTKELAVYYQSIIDGVNESVMVIDKEFNVVIMNKVARQLKPEIELNRVDEDKIKCYELSHNRTTPCEGNEHPCPLTQVFETEKTSVVIHDHKDADGHSHIVELTCTPLWDKNNNLIGVVESAKDITAHLKTKQELEDQKEILHYQSHYDKLTGLANRVLFIDRLNQSIKSAKSYRKKVAVLIIDIDNFKAINDSLGFSVGDEILKSVGKVLEESIRQVDTVASFGADEFAIIISDIDDISSIINIINSCMKVIKEPIKYNEHSLYITLSMGISIYPDDAVKTEILLKNADTAMHRAKEDGRDGYKFYKEDMSEKAFERIVLETSLREAISKEELIVYYQPQVNGETDVIIGTEALVRWNHPSLGLVSPANFIPIAEETGIIVDIDLWVIKTAITQIVAWRKEGLNTGILSMNLSMKLLQYKDFILSLEKIMKDTGCDSSWVELEITESQIMHDIEQSIEVLNKIKELDIKLSIDDFGTGYSSLTYLKRLPIDKLKIDKSFVDELPFDEEDAAITKTIIGLSKSLNLNVIAEGVETIEQKEFLVKEGCPNIQGYYYYKPMPAEQLRSDLKSI